LRELAARLRAAPAVAVDTESNSFYAYYAKVCLVQFSTPAGDYIVDALAVGDLAPLGELFADARVEKIFHGADYDILSLKRAYGFRFAHLFDTMLAARILGWKEVGLAVILAQRFGVTHSKRLQRADWSRRPLSAEHLAYARRDTRYLLQLRDVLHAELVARGRWEEATEEFERLTHLEGNAQRFKPDGFWALRGASALDGHALAVLREVYLFREKEAQKQDRAPFRVLSDTLLLRLAQQRPENLQRLARLQGITPFILNHYGRGLVAAIARGRAASPLTRPPRRDNEERWDEATRARYQALRTWRRERAQKRGVEPDLIVSNDVLRQLAHHTPTTLEALDSVKGLGPWKRREYGVEIIEVIQGVGRG